MWNVKPIYYTHLKKYLFFVTERLKREETDLHVHSEGS